ncbi:MAG: hypothetical protein HYZ87_03755 [Candidatus Omnitrophica bacterium]|nr:hypothetical protein [Candidatus Omnitrophota bacterium]
MDKKIKVGIIAVLAFFGLGFVINGLFDGLIESSLSKAAHVPVRVGSTRVDLWSQSIALRNLEALNPRGFKERRMLDVPLVAIHFDLPALGKGQLHLKEVRLHLKELSVVKNRDGRLNVNAVKADKAEREKTQQTGRKSKLVIDKLYLTIDRVVYKDFTGSEIPRVSSFEIGIQDRLYTNIENPSVLVGLVMFETLTRTTLSSLAHLELVDFKDQGSLALTEGFGFVKGGGKKVEKAAKGLLESIF